MHTFEAGLHTLAPLPWAVHFTRVLGSNKGRADIRGIYIVLYEAHKMVRIVGDILGSASCTMAKQCYLQLSCANQSHHIIRLSLADEGPLWIVHPSQIYMYASISC